MEYLEQDLQELIAKGKAQGYLTYAEVNQYLPDEDVSPEKLDNLILALEEIGVELLIVRSLYGNCVHLRDLLRLRGDTGIGALPFPASDSIPPRVSRPYAPGDPGTGGTA